MAWLFLGILVVLAIGKRRKLIDIDKLDAIAVWQLDEAKCSELGERAAHSLYCQTQKISNVGACHRQLEL
jgi:hypothetical protein